MREQRTQLNRKPSTEVQQGQFGAGRTQTVNMPTVAPAKSSGAKLAEAFGMAVGVAGKIVSIEQDKKYKRKAIFDGVEGNNAGNAEAQRLMKEAKELPLEQRNQYLQQGMSNWLQNFKGQDTTDAFLRGGLEGFTAATSKFEAANDADLLKVQENKLFNATIGSIRTSFINNDSHNNMIEKIKTVNDVGNAQAGKIYVESVAALIKEEAQNDPNYDWQKAIEDKLKIKSEDGVVDYATHPTYGKLIDTLESSLTTLTTARTTAQTKADKKVAVDTTKSILSTLYNPNATAEEIAEAKASIAANQEIFTVEQFKVLNNAAESAVATEGFARNSNPVMFGKLQAQATRGDLKIETLDMLKSKVTTSEYKQLATLILKTEGELENTQTKTLVNGLKDLESRAVKVLNKTTALEFDSIGADKELMFSNAWNAWMVSYVNDNGVRPSYEEGMKKQKELIDLVNASFNEDGGQVQPPIPTFQGQGAVPIDTNNLQGSKQQWLNNATADELRKALEDGSITPQDLGQPVSSNDIDLTTVQPDDNVLAMAETAMNEIDRLTAGPSVYKDILTTASEVGDAIIGAYQDSPLVGTVVTEEDVIKMSMIESSMGMDKSMNEGKYKGVFQLSSDESKGIDATDMNQNIVQTLNVSLPQRLKRLEKWMNKKGITKDITGFDVYMSHQQGANGYTNMLLNPTKKAKYSQGLGDLTNEELIEYFRAKWENL